MCCIKAEQQTWKQLFYFPPVLISKVKQYWFPASHFQGSITLYWHISAGSFHNIDICWLSVLGWCTDCTQRTWPTPGDVTHRFSEDCFKLSLCQASRLALPCDSDRLWVSDLCLEESWNDLLWLTAPSAEPWRWSCAGAVEMQADVCNGTSCFKCHFGGNIRNDCCVQLTHAYHELPAS